MAALQARLAFGLAMSAPESRHQALQIEYLLSAKRTSRSAQN